MTISTLFSLVRGGARMASMEEGPLYVAGEHRALMCLVVPPSNTGIAVLAISSSHQLDPYVLAYQESIKRQGMAFQRLVCSMSQVLELYRHNTVPSLGGGNNDTDVQRYIIRLISQATALNTSDVHIVALKDFCELRFRIDGELRLIKQFRPEEGLKLCATIYQSMCDVAEPTFKPRQAQRARMKDEFLAECGLSGARINTRPLDRGMLMVLRLLYAELPGSMLTLEGLGYLPEQCEVLEAMMEQKTGVVLLSGPTGSGKSTTLKVVMQQLLREQTGIHLLTLEDPPEYAIAGANQSPVSGERGDGGEVEQEWAMAIADAMRLDPDIIMVGEVRDSVTAKMAFRAAMTGHLIWTTIHANDSLAILQRLQDENVMASLLTDARLVTGLVNQSLVQRLCDHCKVPLEGNEGLVSDRLLKRLRQYCQPAFVRLSGPDGCERCRQSGVSGRTVVAEVVRTSPALMQAYSQGGHHAASKHWLNEMSGLSKVDAVIHKVNAGIVDPRAAERVVGPLIPLRYQVD
ncbi:type ii secretion system protein [Chromobacterium violaceum]|nr:type ii secretion system protein [Chromobacterium violaceum]